ncbi:unnamed protein product (mitochondrion) [Musa banksii]
MARKGNPISVRLDLNRSSDPSRFSLISRISFSSHGSVTIDSIYYYGKSVYQDVNLRSYFGSIRPPTILTFGFRLGRCIILHFPKKDIYSFLSSPSTTTTETTRQIKTRKGFGPVVGI